MSISFKRHQIPITNSPQQVHSTMEEALTDSENLCPYLQP